MTSVQTKTCTGCGWTTKVQKIKHHVFDENGSRWHGTRCIGCIRAAARERHALKPKDYSEVAPEEMGEREYGIDPITNRRCRDCQKPLRARHYFWCANCKVKYQELEACSGY